VSNQRRRFCLEHQAMTRLVLLVIVAAVSIGAQRQPDESNVPDSEKRIPPGHYCKRPDVPITPNETKAHACACKYSCSVDEHGNVSEHESPDCLSFCHLHGRRCTCHVEEPCDPKGNALMNMDGRIVAIRMPHRRVVRQVERAIGSK
jgi:hypothetical protein